MSFDISNKTGEAEPLPITDFLQFIPTIGASVVSLALPLGNILSGLTKNALQANAKLVSTKAVLPTKGISNIFAGLKTPTIASNRNLALGGLTVGGLSVLSLTPGGQTLTNTAGQSIQDFTQLGSNITDFLGKNPIVPIALIGLGVLIVIGVMKK